MPQSHTEQHAPDTQPINWIEVLSTLSSHANDSANTFEDILTAIVNETAGKVGADAVAIWTKEDNSPYILINTACGLSDRYIRYFNHTDRVPLGKGLVGSVMQQKTTWLFEDLPTYRTVGIERWGNMVEEEGIKAIIGAPMFTRDDNFGTLCLYYKHEHHFTNSEQLFVETLANQIATLFKGEKQNERITKESERYRKQRDELLHIQSVVQAVDAHIYTSIEEATENLAEYITKNFDAHGLAIMHAVKENQTQLDLIASHNMSPEHTRYLTTQLSPAHRPTLFTQVLRDKELQVVERVFTHPSIEKEWSTTLSKDHITSLVAIPLTAQDTSVGIFLVFFDHLHKPTEEELSVLSTFSQFLAVSLENVKIFRSLNAEKKKNESIVYSLHDGIVVLNNENCIVGMNPRAEELLGIAHTNLVGTNPEGAKETAVLSALAAPLDDYEAHTVLIKEPDSCFLQVTHVPLRDTAHNETGSMRVLHDVTEEHHLRELKNNFIATATHQMRTPLTGMRWGLDTLQNGEFGNLSPAQQALVSKLIETNTFVRNLVNDLFHVSRIENKELSQEKTDVHIGALISQIEKNVALIIQQKNLTWNVRLDDDLPTIFANESELLSAIQNIVDNAVKYTLPGGSVTISVHTRGNTVQCTISDTGIGIAKEDLVHLFTKFYRGKKATSVETVGSGLGLYIAKGIIESYGGSITLESKVDEGTTFVISLPADKKESS